MFIVIAALHGQDAISAKDFGAKGDGVANDTAALQGAFDAACGAAGVPRLHVPTGTYNISSPLVTKCAMIIAGDGPERSILFQTVHGKSNHGIIADYGLTLQDIGIDTEPLTVNKGMVAVFRSDTSSIPGSGQNFTFLRFHSRGFNFGIDLAGSLTLPDDIGTVLVKDCDISVSTEIDAVANPVNVRSSVSLGVEDSTLTGDGNNDHAIYLIGVRKVLIRHNLIQNHGNSAVKLLTAGFHATSCPVVNNDYSSWVILNNTITHSKLALAAYTYCDVQLPSLIVAGNLISNIADRHEGDAAAMYIQANCRSVMDQVTMTGNVFTDIGLSGVFLLSSIQDGAPCGDLDARGTIRSFASTADTYINFSTSYPGAYSAISASGPNLLQASISQMRTDTQGNGRGALNMQAFAHLTAGANIEIKRSCAWRRSGGFRGECPSRCFK